MKKVISENLLKKIIKRVIIKESLEQQANSFKELVNRETDNPQKLYVFRKRKAAKLCECIKKTKRFYTGKICDEFCKTNKITPQILTDCVYDSVHNLAKYLETNPNWDDPGPVIGEMIGCLSKVMGDKKYNKLMVIDQAKPRNSQN
jgi:hypothetical protein